MTQKTQITDEMVDRNARSFRPCRTNFNAAMCDPVCQPCRDLSRKGLEAALDRRTGPKDRRVENDYPYARTWRRRNPRNEGRRINDIPSGALPNKSRRSAGEIGVSEGMLEAAWGVTRWSTCHTDPIAKKYALGIAADIYRAMERVRREEGASPCGWVQTACVEVSPDRYEISGYFTTPHRRKGDPA